MMATATGERGVTFVATSNSKSIPTKVTQCIKANLKDCLSGIEKIVPKKARFVQGSNDNAQVIPLKQGLVGLVSEAYCKHHNLVLRPDDIWQAILTQFSFYVNAHAEELRSKFVPHEGKKELVVQDGGGLFTTDHAALVLAMVHEQIVDNISDPSLVKWLMPAWSTTRDADRVCAGVSIMAVLQKYFDYKFQLLCGIPTVTLLGTPEDWADLCSRVARLPEFDCEECLMSEWVEMLQPVCDTLARQVAAGVNGELQGKAADDALHFWDRVCHYKGGGSGPTYISGWIAVFAVFNAKGEWQGDYRAKSCALWPKIDTDDLPIGWTSVPVKVDDNGTEYKCTMHAGQMAASMPTASSLQPRNDWCIVVHSPNPGSKN